MKSQFARVQTYTQETSTSVLSEANREDGFCSHIETPKPPNWLHGSAQAVHDALKAYALKPAPVILKSGKQVTRKRRADCRCLVAGFISWPEPVSDFNLLTRAAEQKKIADWINKTREWLKAEYGDNLIASVLHVDESHPHLHFFVVGDAQRLHPGMRAELVNDQRMKNNQDRMIAHKKGLKSWLDDYHNSVSRDFDFVRSTDNRPVWRIRDRSVRAAVHKIDLQLAVNADAALLAERNQIWDAEEKTERPEMKF